MILRTVLAVLVGSQLAGCSSDPSRSRDQVLSQLATAFVEQLAKGEFENASRSLGAPLTHALSAEDLRKQWDMLIEHVGGWADQRTAAAEIRRISPRLFVQTPNRYFPVEPHFLVPGFQFLPIAARVALVRRFALGHMPREPEPERAMASVKSIRLLDAGAMRALFPGSRIFREKIGFLTKSLVAYQGWETGSDGIKP